MPDFNEDFLQFIWQNKLLLPIRITSITGKEIQVLKQGELNSNSGPDFFNAQIKINHIVLVGNIELHLKTSDWNKHKHFNDKNYNNIILHVVYKHDIEIQQNIDNNVEVVELHKYIDPLSIVNYKRLFNSKQPLACASQLKQCNDFKFTTWLDRMLIARLEAKVWRIEEWFELSKGDYAQIFYFALLRNYGFNVNADAFELLAKQLPLNILLKHADNLLQLESLLLGTAGMLNEQQKDAYLLNLQNEFEFLKNKYKIIPLQREILKFSRLRPANFPNLRLAQFAALMHQAPEIFSKPHKNTNYLNLFNCLNISLTGYWKNHYKMDGKIVDKDLKIGKSAVENLITNTFAPFLFFYAKKTNNEALTDGVLKLLQACSFEKNNITKLYNDKKHLLKDAANSQSLIYLYHHYCKTKQCLKCGIAAALLKPVTNA